MQSGDLALLQPRTRVYLAVWVYDDAVDAIASAMLRRSRHEGAFYRYGFALNRVPMPEVPEFAGKHLEQAIAAGGTMAGRSWKILYGRFTGAGGFRVMIEPQPDRISLVDFLAWEETQDHKHELLDGEILAFSGGSFDHNDIALNVCALLRERVAPPCKAHSSDTIIETRASKDQSVLRADASVSCSSEDAGKAKYMRHPRIVVEVRSPSNVGAKWENKLFEYRDTHSIEQIVIIESETRSVRSYVRDDERQWREEPTLVGDGVLAFRVDNVEMTLDEIYWRTSLAKTATKEN